MAASNEQGQQNNILLLLLEFQDRGYDRLLSIANTVGSSDVLIQAINDAKFRNDEPKNKDGSHLTTGSLSNNRSTANSIAASSSTDVDHRYKQGMNFVEQFKQARIEQGHKKMDWITCLKEEKELGLLNYKNADALRNQFAKYTKKQAKDHQYCF